MATVRIRSTRRVRRSDLRLRLARARLETHPHAGPITIGSRYPDPTFRGWCNRQHSRFWPCHWGFESSPPSPSAPSSSGLGRRPLKAETTVRICSGLLASKVRTSVTRTERAVRFCRPGTQLASPSRSRGLVREALTAPTSRRRADEQRTATRTLAAWERAQASAATRRRPTEKHGGYPPLFPANPLPLCRA